MRLRLRFAIPVGFASAQIESMKAMRCVVSLAGRVLLSQLSHPVPKRLAPPARACGHSAVKDEKSGTPGGSALTAELS